MTTRVLEACEFSVLRMSTLPMPQDRSHDEPDEDPHDEPDEDQHGEPDDKKKIEFAGNGFVVFYDKGKLLILTCEHCLGADSQMRFHFSNSTDEGIIAHLVYEDKPRDLALFYTEKGNLPCVPLSFIDNNETPEPGSDVVLLAFHSKGDGVILQPGTFPGVIMGETQVKTPGPNWNENIQSNYTCKIGTSGAPVIKPDELKVVGVHMEAEMAAKYAISVRTVKAFLREQLKEDTGTIRQMLREIANSL